MEKRVQAAAIWLLMLLHGAAVAQGGRTRDKMYQSIVGAGCFRRLNGTHQTGCSSTHAGSVGVLHLINVEADLEFLLASPPSPPYAPMIPPHLFTRQNLLRLIEAGPKNISVVLLINKPEKMKQFSHELNCPNQYSSLNNSETCDASNPATSWNPWGTGLLHEDFPFPIYYIADTEEITKLEECFEKFNNFDYETHAQRSLCAVEVKSFMSAAVSSEVCIRRTRFINNLSGSKYCDPLEGRNVYATVYPRNITTDESEVNEIITREKFILVSCRLDTASMFDGVGLGAMDSLVGLAILTQVANLLRQLLPPQSSLPDTKRNVLFVTFNGESYDYIGSQRFVYDVERFAFPKASAHRAPITFDNIEFMLDIGTLDDIANIKLHALSGTPLVQKLLQQLNSYAQSPRYGFNLNIQSEMSYHIPPTSAQSFLRRDPRFPALILNAKPANKYYHSIYDDVDNVAFTYGNTSQDFTLLLDVGDTKGFKADALQMKVRNVSSIVAMALYETLTGKEYTGSKVANPVLADEFFYCFLMSADCPLFKAASYPGSPKGLPMPPMRYVSVLGGPQESSGWTYRVLGYLLSQQQPKIPKDNCTVLPLHYFAGFNGAGECRLTTQNYSSALSPAFLIDDYDWRSGNYSTWTESTWSLFSARIFLRPSSVHQITTLSVGIVVLILSFCLVYIISSRSEVLFEDLPASNAALPPPTAC
ncbi:nicastrin isoform X1 [Drosophila guanche]|uniref:nicastrin isoform X1 n=1 Tax=Drosophila guanche TaxID=7266 RepID=UPI00147117AB|nr:nicastrin isoform X1 [Drosophila guanche]XP_034127982.1 nicastrin isoform X1 [Drosophila guanche]